MWPNPEESADLVTFTEEILNGKIHFLCSVLLDLNCGVFIDPKGSITGSMLKRKPNNT